MSTLGHLARRLAEVTLSTNVGAFPIPLAREPLRPSGFKKDDPPVIEYDIPPEYEGLFRASPR